MSSLRRLLLAQAQSEPTETIFYGTQLGYEIDITLPYKYFAIFIRNTRYALFCSDNPILYGSSSVYMKGNYVIYRSNLSSKLGLVLYVSGNYASYTVNANANSISGFELTNYDIKDFATQTTVLYSKNYNQTDYD